MALVSSIKKTKSVKRTNAYQAMPVDSYAEPMTVPRQSRSAKPTRKAVGSLRMSHGTTQAS